MQQCAAGNLRIYIGSLLGPRGPCGMSTQREALLCSWLKHHAGLVGSISFFGAQMGDLSCESLGAYYDEADKLLALGLQDAAGAAASTPAAAATAATHAKLQLRSFDTGCVRSTALLRALPAASHLDLQRTWAWGSGLRFDHSSISAALGQLSNLRSLTLEGEVGNACLAAVGQLAQLTQLTVNKVVAADSEDFDAVVTVALGHLTALKVLKLSAWCNVAAGSALPTSLTALTVAVSDYADEIGSSMQHLGLTALQQLQRLQARGGIWQPQLMKQLSTLAALTHIEQNYMSAGIAVHAAPGWQHLSALHTLDLDFEFDDDDELDAADSAVLLRGLAAATSVVHLSMKGCFVHDSSQLCAHLACLLRLQSLELRDTRVASQADALHLAALTGLTKLVLVSASGVDDVAASVLALRLTRLQELLLVHCGLRSAAALPSIATLTGLTSLVLGPAVVTDGSASVFPLGKGDLELLTPLTQLKHLANGDYGQNFFCDNAVAQLWCEVQQQWQQQQPA
jgi:hypothetical protein